MDKKTKFNVKVDKVYQDEKGLWIINDPSNGRFDGVIAAVGTCGAPKSECGCCDNYSFRLSLSNI